MSEPRPVISKRTDIDVVRLVRRRLYKRKGIALGGLMVLMVVLTGLFAPVIAPFDPFAQDLNQSFQPPSKIHPFGTDQFGRDILARVAYGARITIVEILLSVVMSLAIGVPMGVAAGYHGGYLDQLVMWLLDIIFAFPGILLAILIVSALGPSLFNMLIAISIFSVPIYGRLARNLTLVLKQMEFIEAARAIGASRGRIMFRHILKNAIAPLLVQATLTAGGVVLTASGLSFLGLGAQPPTPEWGAMISTGRHFEGIAPHISLFPGLAIIFVVLGFNILGDGLRDLLDPRFKS